MGEERAGGGRWAIRSGIGWLVLGCLWALLVPWMLRLGEPTAIGWVLSSGLHLLLLAAWPVAIAAIALRRWPLAAAAVLTVAVHLLVSWPLLPLGSDESPRGPRITVASWNTYVDNDDPDAAARLIARRPPDVLVLQELTPTTEAALRRAGVEQRYPHRVGQADPGTTGAAVWSRFEVEQATPSIAVPDVLFARVVLPSGATLTVADVHAFGPQPDDPGVWVRTLHQLDRALADVRGPWIALGDFNATTDHRAYRDLLHDGRRDAHVATGRGYARSWPASGPLPPVVLIDHAIVSRRVQVASTGEQTLPGSDHRMIRLSIAVDASADG